MAAMATVLASIQQNLGSGPGGAAAPAQPEAPPPNPPDPSLPPPPRAEPNLASPRVFGGDFDQGKGFLHQCELLFRRQPSRFVSDEAKVGFLTSLLADKALSWAIAAVDLDPRPRLSSDYSAFRREFKAVFEHPTYGEDAASRLLALQQGSRSVAEYTLEFRILAAESRRGETALHSAYRRGLSEAIKDLIVRDRPSSLNELITLSLQMDERLRERRQERAQRAGGSDRQLSHRTPSAPDFSPTSTAAPPPHIPWLPPAHSFPRAGEEAMQIGRSRLSPQEREQRLRDQRCLYCGNNGHFIKACPVRPKGSCSPVGGVLVSRTVIPQPTEQHNRLFPATLSWDKESIPVSVLIDSGAEESLMDFSLARQAGVPLVPLDRSLSLQAIDGRSLGNITHRTIPLTLTLSGNHIESTRFLVLHAPTAPLVLGRPWLERHNPHISWASGRILGWSVACHADCLRSAPSPSSNPRDPDTIIPPARVIGVISWPIETAVEQAQRDEPDPGNGPRDWMFVPSSVRPQVLECGHSSCFACHPGVRRTAEFVQRRFWWPNLQEDVQEFVGACTVCARSKASHRSPAGLLHPLPVPS
uniref:Gypsy retrotransposon integrase-like protein 1 n=1 Tax=Takifugu rubripes TaxID=31033 RepID=A0A674NN42_TAKRU